MHSDDVSPPVKSVPSACRQAAASQPISARPGLSHTPPPPPGPNHHVAGGGVSPTLGVLFFGGVGGGKRDCGSSRAAAPAPLVALHPPRQRGAERGPPSLRGVCVPPPAPLEPRPGRGGSAEGWWAKRHPRFVLAGCLGHAGEQAVLLLQDNVSEGFWGGREGRIWVPLRTLDLVPPVP